jgi:hypothetical protein
VPHALQALRSGAAHAIVVHLALDRSAVPAASPPLPTASEPPASGFRAAHGDDDLMSAAQDPAEPTTPAPAWSTRIAAARFTWPRLSDREVAATAGDARRLTTLVEQRYGLPRPDAARAVRRFLARAAR